MSDEDSGKKHILTRCSVLPPQYSDHCFLMSLHVALDIDREGQAGNVTRHHQDLDGQGSRPPSQSLGSDAQAVNLREDL